MGVLKVRGLFENMVDVHVYAPVSAEEAEVADGGAATALAQQNGEIRLMLRLTCGLTVILVAAVCVLMSWQISQQRQIHELMHQQHRPFEVKQPKPEPAQPAPAPMTITTEDGVHISLITTPSQTASSSPSSSKPVPTSSPKPLALGTSPSSVPFPKIVGINKVRGMSSHSSCGWKGESMPPLQDWTMLRQSRPSTLHDHVTGVARRLFAVGEAKMASMYETCTCLTIDTALHRLDPKITNGREEVFVSTGDIGDMWLRDSAGQMKPYIHLAKNDPALQSTLEGVIRLQLRLFLEDPYANSFSSKPRPKTGSMGGNDVGGWVATRNFELDSVCYVVALVHEYWQATGRTEALGINDKLFGFQAFVRGMLDLFKVEQEHGKKSTYTHFSLKAALGMGTPVGRTGMVWSGFRPSDDAQEYGYHIPDNMFASIALAQCAELLTSVFEAGPLVAEVLAMKADIDKGIDEYGTTQHKTFGRIYAYETDGLGNFKLMDDANVPSLLSIPYLGYSSPHHDTAQLYANTRKFILSPENPYYYASNVAQGVGSPHTRGECIWPMSIIMRGLTAESSEEVEAALRMAMGTDGDTLYMHESFKASDPSDYTRGWFGWVNALFSQLVDKYMENRGI
eukprot:c20743_g1_i1.p1 GENE.c20743_g1_i1~~c20743_g1_i1.p1  ORF type:complete len:624 (-),score=131.12 c20743_g1_i1:977-2848(-)